LGCRLSFRVAMLPGPASPELGRELMTALLAARRERNPWVLARRRFRG
jgi:hypothetical protein